MPPRIRLALRDWDFLTPILLGDVRSPDVELVIDRVAALPEDPAGDPRYDGAEVSFSRYAQARARGAEDLVGLPHFIMRGFRQRCVITAKDSPLTRFADLAGRTIGLTGWQDSGNLWTRALLRREGVEIGDATWWVGRLTAAHPVVDRLGGFGRPGRIEAVPGERPLVDLLLSGEMAAAFTPFMPPGFFAPDSPLRPLLPDCRAAEVAYFHAVGYVPGIHALALKPAVVAAHPGLPRAISELLDESARLWLAKREKYADTTPWIIDELARCARDLPAGWDASGLAANEAMIDAFAAELHAQGITARRLDARALFPHAAG
ncbi:ABC transporter substrate-binding protein [Roseomonas sp. GC11]|uniref:ABC transporter substrate-binding protein n=1 Tax=Roseomonas sp. GC11 TaxID=2950546 RepID=UPI00210C7A2E|nr:ABC transporter substrate-binding protein [Roseomonas sp. GC11]MCQ4161829.1 ABC transporter substrate-binding protein [Roseomonas sp. GC11]